MSSLNVGLSNGVALTSSRHHKTPVSKVEVLGSIMAMPARSDTERLVWYAAYGSNLKRSRFESYVSGCRDESAPRDDRLIELPYELYFADHSETWGGAPAFVRRSSSNVSVYARMYLISYDQFNDVVRQENGRRIPGATIVPNYLEIAQGCEWRLDNIRLYGRMLRIGFEETIPIITFTATSDDFEVGPPSECYVRTIVSGLEETYPCLAKSEIRDYLFHCDGIRDSVPLKELTRWVLND
jgi:hypothetical protein